MAATSMTRVSWCKHCPPSATNKPGFTLLELMIVCALAAILLMLAVPGYQGYVMRSHRSMAIEQLLAAAVCQERIYARQFSYDTSKCLESGEESDEEPGKDHYAFRFEPPAVSGSGGFVIVAEPLAAQRADPCGNLILDQTGERSITGPRSRVRLCWEGR
jgi:type IV pilus assembly protein PilE